MPEPGAPTRIVLVGFMASGKTSVGRELARLLGWDFVDLDESIERSQGRSIAAIFDHDGEPAFRELEREAAREACRRERVVIAAGGGAFAQPDTREILRRGSLSVFLYCALEVLLERTALGGHRPLARNRETMRRLYAEREPVYRLADRVVDTAVGAPREIAAGIARDLGPGRLEGTPGT